MRILFAQTTPYLPQEAGGALSNTDTMCRLLLSRGIAAEVLAADARKFPHSLLGARGAPLTYPVRRSHDPLAVARQICSENRPDLAIVQLGDIAALSDIFVQAGVPTIIYIHDRYTFDDALVSDKSSLLSFAGCSSYIAEHMHRRLGCDIFVIPVLIESSLYRAESTRKFVTFVNPIPRKGSEIAFVLAAARPDIPFAFVEAWNLRRRVRKYLEGRVAHYGNIRLLGRTDDMRRIYRSSRVMLAPSVGDEAWGRVVSEAQVSGIPALASNSGGLPDAVGAGGIVVDRHADNKEWLAALSELWDDTDRYDRFVECSYAHAARADFQPDVVVERAIAYFRSRMLRK